MRVKLSARAGLQHQVIKRGRNEVEFKGGREVKSQNAKDEVL